MRQIESLHMERAYMAQPAGHFHIIIRAEPTLEGYPYCIRLDSIGLIIYLP